MSIQNPHDRFFRESFGRLDVVRNYLEEYLPSQIVDVLALDTLTRQDGSFIDEEMQAHQTDMLYEVRLTTGERATLYFLFEHKSYPDKLISLQLLRYMVRFWEQQVKDKVELMSIIPLVIYHGEKAWRVPRDFLSLFHPPEALQPYLPQFNYLLSDFSHLSNEPIRGTIWLRVSLEVLKGIFSPRLEEELPELMRLLFQLDDGKTGLAFIRTVLYYLTVATEKVSHEALKDSIRQHSEQGEQIMSTIAQELIEQGIGQGIGLGVEQSIQRVIERRFGTVPSHMTAYLAGLSNDALNDILDEAIVSKDLNAFMTYLMQISTPQR